MAELIGTTEADVRQLHARARRHVAGEPSRDVDPASWRELIARFLLAARDGDVAGLEALFAEDVVSRADGGGVVHAARRPVQGRDNVARYLVGLVHRFQTESRPVLAEVNGVPAIALVEGASLRGVLVLHASGGLLTALDPVVNPDRLAFAQGQLSRIGRLPGPSG